MLDAAVLIPRPVEERVLPDLGMRCSEKEIPDTLANWTRDHNLKPDGWWLAAGCFFEGSASPLNSYGELAEAEQVTAGRAMELSLASANLLTQLQATTNCTAAFCIADGRLLVIVSPNDASEAAIWVAAACSSVTVESRGTQGLRGRPLEVCITGKDWTMQLREIARNYLERVRGKLDGRFQTGQEASFLKALADASAVSPKEAADTAPLIGADYVWRPEDSLGGIYRLIRGGHVTTATALVDRELPMEDQLKILEAMDWVPQTVLSSIVKATREGTLDKLWIPELPDGRVGSPFPNVNLQLFVGGEASHPVHRYLWPSFSSSRDLNLDHGEELEHSWKPSASVIARHSPNDPDGIGAVGTPVPSLDQHGYMTNARLVSSARRDPSGVGQGDERLWCASHYRWEWIYEVGTVRLTKFKRTGIFAKPVPFEDTEGLYLRMRLASGWIYEIRFPEVSNQPALLRELVDRSAQLIVASGSDRQIRPETHSTNKLALATISRSAVPIGGAIPYSLPDRVC
jgi:hypothetical protein